MTGRRPYLRRIGRNESGATIIEFALIAPTFFIMLMGVFDIGYAVYVKSVLSGAVQKAARDSALETGASALTTIDGEVERSVLNVAGHADVSFERKSYFEFTDVGRSEVYADDNGNGACDNNETFEDENSNGVWDADIGRAGVGGARDVVLYTVNVKYAQLFPLYEFLGRSQDRMLSSTSLLKNQPFGQQGEAVLTVGSCP